MFTIIPIKRSSQLLAIVFFASLLGTLFLARNYQNTTQTLLQAAQESAKQKTITAAQELNGFISSLITPVDSLAKELSTKKLSQAEIEKRLKEKPAEFSGFGVAFTPYSYHKNKKLYAPYYFEQENRQKLIDIADVSDYTQPEYTWFSKPLIKGAGFIDPYFGQATETILVEYSAPFYQTDETGKQKPAGIVFANIAMNYLKYLLRTVYFGRTGYWFILAKDGTFLTHPKDQFVADQVTIFDIAKKHNDETLTDAGKQAAEGKSVFVEYVSEMTNNKSWLLSEPIPATGWSICGIFDKSELPIDTDLLRQKLMHIGLSMLLSLILLVLLIASFFSPGHQLWWFISLSTSVLLTAELGMLWYSTSLYPDYKENLTVITSKSMLYSFLKKTLPTPSLQKREKKEEPEKSIPKATPLSDHRTYLFEKPTYVPTGIFVSHMQFAAENQIAIVCYIWQRYTDGIHDKLSRGFILPQATTITIKELSRSKQGKIETIIWQVQATLNQQLSYARYPFDVKDLQVQLWHQDFDENIILVPDLDAYRLINPRALPGLGPNAYFAGWYIQGTHFGYRNNDYNTVFGMYTYGPFGIEQQIEKSTTPELYFDVTVKRRLLDTLVSDLLPLIVIAVLLFVILLTCVAQGYGVLGSCASVFFGLVFAQVRFRVKIPTYQLVYFEHFYFILYAALMAIVTVSILYLLKLPIPFVQYNRNMVAKLLYWPITLATLIGITLYYLY